MEHLGFIFFSSAEYCKATHNFMILMNFQQLKKKRFRGFSTHFVVFRELICLFTKHKKWGKHIYDFV